MSRTRWDMKNISAKFYCLLILKKKYSNFIPVHRNPSSNHVEEACVAHVVRC